MTKHFSVVVSIEQMQTVSNTRWWYILTRTWVVGEGSYNVELGSVVRLRCSKGSRYQAKQSRSNQRQEPHDYTERKRAEQDKVKCILSLAGYALSTTAYDAVPT